MLLSGLIAPRSLCRPYRFWMLLALALGWTSTRILLTLAYWILVTPIGLLMNIMRKDVLDQRINKDSTSYWKKRDAVGDKKQYKKQF